MAGGRPIASPFTCVEAIMSWHKDNTQFLPQSHKFFCPLGAKSSQYSLVGTFVYCDFTSKLTNSSPGNSQYFFNESQIFLVEILILHSGTRESQTTICLPILWYAEPDIHITITGLIGVPSLLIFASPCSLGWLPTCRTQWLVKIRSYCKSLRIPMFQSSLVILYAFWYLTVFWYFQVFSIDWARC